LAEFRTAKKKKKSPKEKTQKERGKRSGTHFWEAKRRSRLRKPGTKPKKKKRGDKQSAKGGE